MTPQTLHPRHTLSTPWALRWLDLAWALFGNAAPIRHVVSDTKV